MHIDKTSDRKEDQENSLSYEYTWRQKIVGGIVIFAILFILIAAMIYLISSIIKIFTG